MIQHIAIMDFTAQNLGRIFIGDIRRDGFSAYQGEYPDVRVQEGGLMTPDFPRTATVIVMTNQLQGTEGVLTILDRVIPLLSPSNKLLLIEHDQFNGENPDKRNEGAGTPWSKESWLSTHFSRMTFNLRHYDVKLLCSVIVEVAEKSWAIVGDDTYLGRF